MYTIERTETEVIIRENEKAVYMAKPDSYIIYKPDVNATPVVKKISDLTDPMLLLAVVSAVKIKA